MRIKKHRRQLANGEEKIYSYAISDDGQSIPLGSSDLNSSVSSPLYRTKEKRRISAALQANSSLLVIGEAGCGKTFLGNSVIEELVAQGFLVAKLKSATVKQTIINLVPQTANISDNDLK